MVLDVVISQNAAGMARSKAHTYRSTVCFRVPMMGVHLASRPCGRPPKRRLPADPLALVSSDAPVPAFDKVM